MNKDQLLGNMKIFLGRLHENLARLTGSQMRHRDALQLQEAGKVQRTLGEARRIIKRSIKQQMSV
ncbi:hypothetical protein [Herbaspirillum sp. RV1423]|uniref:hypothetical protein n=1 Tax=Herbaspirillum sp. RV1423 TaxID=1443993 RepID=UPI0004BAF2FD|nr:hypothetical protein [Herbaspirillum sp. RV1423]